MAFEDPSWDLHRSFLAVMREGSLSAAARALGMTQPSLGRHIRALEQRLGVALFTRSPQGLTPTEMAHELLPHAQAMAAASAAMRRAASASQDELRGVVRISASEVIGGEVLPAMLAAFRERHPGIVVELVLSNQTADLLRKDVDIAVRMVQPTQQALVARKVGTIPLRLYAHRRYLKAHGTPQRIEQLADHALIGFDHEPPYVRSLRPPGFVYSREHFALRTDSDLAALAALRAGYGIGFCQTPLAARERQLVPVLPDAIALALPTWLVMHEDLRRSHRHRAMFDFLADAVARYASGESAT
jgi:DNA-binding transcriptional LysR family regulator